MNWNIGFEWIVTGAAVIGVIALLIVGEDQKKINAVPSTLQSSGSLP